MCAEKEHSTWKVKERTKKKLPRQSCNRKKVPRPSIWSGAFTKRCIIQRNIFIVEEVREEEKMKRFSFNRIEHLLHICIFQLKRWNDLLKRKCTTYFSTACMSFVRSFVRSFSDVDGRYSVVMIVDDCVSTVPMICQNIFPICSVVVGRWREM